MKHLLLIASLFLTVSAFANTEGKSNVSYSMAGLEVGFRWASAEYVGSSSNNQVIGFQIGGSGVFDIGRNFAVKSGLFYNERPFKSTFAPGSQDRTGKITYFDIPLLLMFKFEDYAGVYIGPSMSVKLSNEVSPGTLTGIKGTVTPLLIGAQFKFASNLGVNVYFETVSGELADDIENARAVGANLLLTFD